MTEISRLYGLNVAAPWALGHPADDASDVDLEIEVSPDPADPGHGGHPAGRLIAWQGDPAPYFSLVERPAGGYAYRVRDVVDIDISPDRRYLRCRMADGADAGMLPVLVSGNLLASLLLLDGHCVLHASAIERDGDAVAFVGTSRSGKSSLAALCCRAGTRLVTDDVLRIDTVDGQMICYRGGPSLRLRPAVRSVASVLREAAAVSADGRHLLDAPATALDRMPIRALYLPVPTEAAPLSRQLLAPKAALLALLGRPRVLNWSDPTTGGEHFESVGSVVDRVPCYTLAIRPGILPDEDVATGGDWPKRIVDVVFAPHPL